MTTRLDQVLQKHPDHEGSIRILASRDPSGNLKYLDWQAKVLASGQALATEIADITDLFHKYAGQWFGTRRERIRPDIYSYRPQDLANLRDNLLKIKRANDRKRKKRERLYKIEGAMEADVVYDSDDLIVRHIKNKNASVHYGLGTKWCISMNREAYFEDYESHNATFFFFERKKPVGDEYDKMVLMLPRDASGDRGWRAETVSVFTSLDEVIDLFSLARVHGTRVFDIFRDIYERSAKYQGSVVFQVHQGTATAEQLAATLAILGEGKLNPYEVETLLEAICCNEAATAAMLEDILARAAALKLAAWKQFERQFERQGRRAGLRRRRRFRGGRGGSAAELMKTITAAIAIHPSTPPELRETLVKALRRRRIKIEDVHVDKRRGHVSVVYGAGFHAAHRRRHRRHASRLPLSRMRQRLIVFQNCVKRTKKRIKFLERKKRVAEVKKARKLKIAVATAKKTRRKS